MASLLASEKAVEDVSEALPLTGRGPSQKFWDSLNEIEDTDIRSRVLEEGKQSLQQIKDVRRAAKEQIKLANQREDFDTADRLRNELESTQETDPEPGVLRKGANLLFDALDASGNLVRQSTTTAFGSGKMYERPITQAEWTADVRRVAKENTPRGHLAAAVRRPAQVLGVGVGLPLGVGVAAMGALTDIPNLIKGERTLEDIKRSAGEVIDETRKDTEDVALSMYTDPLSYVSLGVGGASKNAGQAALRTAVKAGLSRGAAEQLATQTAKLVQVAGGTERAAPSAVKLWEKAFAKAGLAAGEGEKAARSTFGKGMEMLGRGQLELHAPGLSQYSVNPLAKVTGKEYAGGKLLKKIADPLLTKAGRRPLFDPTKEHLKTAKREAQALAETTERQDVDAYKAELAKLPKGSKIGEKATREGILDEYLDPQVAEIGPKRSPDALFGPGAEQFALANENWFLKQADELKKTGILAPEQMAANPISGQYIPRHYKSVIKPFEEISEAAIKGRYPTSPSMTKARKLELPTDDLPYAKREKDLFKIVPQYAKQSARLRAQKSLEDRLVKFYGQKPGIGAGSKLKQPMTFLPDRGVEVPADVANVLRGTFDQGLTTIGRGLRNMGVGATPQGRALLAVLDAYSSAATRMKGLVLKTPAYHAVNMTDDTVKMMLAGMHNPMAWLARARQMIGGKAVNVGGRAYTLTDANIHKIGMGAAARFERGGGKAATRALERTADTAAGTRGIKRVGDAAEKVNDVSNYVGDQWENTSKIAHWLWRLEAGDSPVIAARRTFETLIDYGDRSKAEQILGWFVPFIKYAWSSPKSTLQAAVRNPGAFNLMERSLQAAEGEGHAPRQYITERGRYLQPGPEGERMIGNVREAFGGAPKRQGLSMGILPRLTPYEAFKPITELAQGNVDPLMMMLGPASKFAAEYATERDLMTKQPMSRPSLTSLFPAEAPVPESIRASVGQMPWFSRNVPSFLMSPGPQMLGNYAINQLTGPAGPISTIGSYRPYTGRDQPEDIYAMQFAKYMFGHPSFETTPADPLWTIAHQPEMERAVKGSQASKRKKKQEREAERRKRK